jgi:hypothetical protein
MAKTDWQMGDTVKPDDLNQIGQEINENADAITDHVAATTGVHGATSAATPNTIVQRDAQGRIKAAAPSAASDVARKAEVDAVQTNLNNHVNATTGVHGATSAATPNTIVQRDSAGRFKAAAPAASDDVARKAETDAALTAATAAQAKADAALPASQYTSENILAKLKTVDGEGSGLDADMLDGQHAFAFSTAVNAGYNEDPNTTQKAYIVTNHANAPIGGVFWYIRTFFYSSLTGNRAQIAIRYANFNQMYIRYYFNGLWSPWAEVITNERAFFDTDLVLPNGKGLYIRDSNGNPQVIGAIAGNNIIMFGDADLPVEIRGTTVNINGSKVWHAGNDGAGSGLDADMLDGLHASSFLQTAGGTVSGALAVGGNLTANGGENRIKNLIVNGGYFEVESYGSQYGSGKLRTYFDANNRRWVLTANIGGTAEPLKLDLNGALLIADNDSPEGSVAAPPGSIYLRIGGSAGQTFYVKVSGTGNTGWQAVA